MRLQRPVDHDRDLFGAVRRTRDGRQLRGIARVADSDTAEALDALRTAAALGEKKEPRFDRFFWLGILYAQVDSVPQATQAFERAVQLDTTSALAGKAYRQLGFYRLLKSQWVEATSLLERAVQLDEKDVQAWVWLGQGYQNAGNRPKALAAYRRALEADERFADAHFNLARLYEQAGKRAAALRHLRAYQLLSQG